MSTASKFLAAPDPAFEAAFRSSLFSGTPIGPKPDAVPRRLIDCDYSTLTPRQRAAVHAQRAAMAGKESSHFMDLRGDDDDQAEADEQERQKLYNEKAVGSGAGSSDEE